MNPCGKVTPIWIYIKFLGKSTECAVILQHHGLFLFETHRVKLELLDSECATVLIHSFNIVVAGNEKHVFLPVDPHGISQIFDKISCDIKGLSEETEIPCQNQELVMLRDVLKNLSCLIKNRFSHIIPHCIVD